MSLSIKSKELSLQNSDLTEEGGDAEGGDSQEKKSLLLRGKDALKSIIKYVGKKEDKAKKVEEDDPFANLDITKEWGFFERWKEQRTRRQNEVMREMRARADLKFRETELQLMETEEKLSWDAYELPTRNRLRLIAEHESFIQEEREHERRRRIKEQNMKEEGFTSFNGFIQDFSRWRDSPALFHSHVGHKGAVLSFRITSDFSYIISCSEDQLVKMWDMQTQKCVRTFEGHGKAVRDCDVLPSFTKENNTGGLIVSGSADKTVRIWDAIYADCKKIIRGHTDVVYACAFTPNGDRIASASADRTLRLWDTHEGHLIYIYNLHESAVISCTFSPTGRYLLSSSDYGERHIKLWYTDMPYMKEKQIVGFRLLWETTGVIRRFTVKYDAKPGFFSDQKSAQAEMDEEDAKDEDEEENGEDEEGGSGDEDEEEDESKKEAEREKEEERLALELPDTQESYGFSVSVNSVDRFGRQSQVSSYYAGIVLTVVLRGVDPFQQFFLGAYYKRAQFESFDTKSGDRVGTFSKDSEVVGTKLCCGRKAIASRPAMKPESELSFKWKAPTVPPGQGVSQTGVVVIKATIKRDPLSLGPDEEDPGLVQVCYTLKEVDAPKKGSVLSEISQKADKEEKTYAVDLVANHQLFIDFIRNQDKYSAGTMLSPKCHMLVDGQDITSPEKVMEALEEIMMTGSVIVKDAKLLCNGITYNSLDRDKAQVIKKKIPPENLEDSKEKVDVIDQEKAAAPDEALTSDASVDAEGTMIVAGAENQSTDDNLLALSNAVLGDGDEGGQEVGMEGNLALVTVEEVIDKPDESDEPDEESLMRKRTEELNKKGRKKLPFAYAPPGARKGQIELKPGDLSVRLRKVNFFGQIKNVPRVDRARTMNIRKRAEREYQSMVAMHNQRFASAAEIRTEYMPGSEGLPLIISQRNEDELVSEGKFGVGVAHYRMDLPEIYPINAVSYNKAALDAKKDKEQMELAQQQLENRIGRKIKDTPEEQEKIIQSIMESMIEDDDRLREAAKKRRNAFEILPALEDFDRDFAASTQVKHYLHNRAGKWKNFMVTAKERKLQRDAEALEKIFLLEEQSRHSHHHSGALKGSDYDRTRRRNAFSKLPGFQEKPEIESAIDQELEFAREHGGLIRNFMVAEGDFKSHHNSVNQIAFSLDERRVASCSTDKSIRLWDLKSGMLVNTLIGHKEAVMTVAFSDEGQRLLSSGLDNHLIIWNISSGEPLRTFYGHDDAVHRVSFFRNSTAFASCSCDRSVKVWYLTPQPPAAPQKPVVAYKTQSSMILTWRAPPAFNEEITAFHLQWRVGIREAFGNDITTAGNEYKRTITGLVPGTAYQYRVRAVNRMGVGNWSEPSAQTITDIDVPEPLSRPEVMEVNPYSLGISWHAPTASVEGSSINRFVVQLAGAGISYEDKVQQVITWTEGRAYYESYLTRQESLGHLGNDASGQSGENVEILMEAKMARRKRQEILLAKERQRKDEEAARERRERMDRGDFSGAKQQQGDKKKKKTKKKKKKLGGNSSEGQGALVATNGSTSGSDVKLPRNMVQHYYVYEGLKPGYMYRIRVAGVSSIGQGKWSRATFSTMTRSTRPSPPLPPFVPPSSISMFGLRVEWRAPEENGSSITRFVIRLCHDGSTVTVNQNYTHIDLDDLQPGCAYSFQLRAGNQEGTSDWSPVSKEVWTLTSKTETPEPPVSVDSGIDWIDLHAQKPFENGAPIERFTVQRREISMYTKATWGNERVIPVKPSEGQNGEPCLLHIPELLADRTYDFRINAINKHGASEWSLASKRSRTKPPLLPDAPAKLRVDEVYPIAIVFSWDEPYFHGAPVISYTVEQLRVSRPADENDWEDQDGSSSTASALTDSIEGEGGNDAALQAALNAEREEEAKKDAHVFIRTGTGKVLSKRVDNLVTGSTYRFRVAAENSVGIGKYSRWTPNIQVTNERYGDPVRY